MKNPTLSTHELSKLREKFMDISKSPMDREHNTSRLAGLILRRHGYNPKTHIIDTDAGVIVERRK